MPGLVWRSLTVPLHRFRNGTASLSPELGRRIELTLAGRPFAFTTQNGLRTQDGRPYGEGVQFTLEDELEKAYTDFDMKGGAGIVLDAATGEVRAIASWPAVDPNHPQGRSDVAKMNRAIGATYELPGLRGFWCPENHVRITGELVGVLGNDVANQRGPSPVETRVGMVSEVRSWLAIAGRVGIGLNDEIGSPRFRGLLEVVYRR